MDDTNGQESSKVVTVNIEDLVKDGRNKYPVVCVRCPSRILNSNAADYKEIEFPLPLMTLAKDKIRNETIDKENLNQFWMVADKYGFENVGFSNTVSGLKYLTCADCEIGPIGWFDPASQLSYVSLSRIKHLS